MNRNRSRSRPTEWAVGTPDKQSKRSKGWEKKHPNLSKGQTGKKRGKKIQKGDQITLTPKRILSFCDASFEKSLEIKEFGDVPVNRARMLDWYLQVFSAFQMGWETYWCTVQLLDHLIKEYRYIKVDNIHIVGVTCMFIGSKIHQSHPPKLKQDIIPKVVFFNFSLEAVVQEEARILTMISNSSKPIPHMNTIYNQFYEIYPKMSAQLRVEVFRQLVMIWMDPQCCLSDNETTHISYPDLVRKVTTSAVRGAESPQIVEVRELYGRKFNCITVQPGWQRIHKLKL